VPTKIKPKRAADPLDVDGRLYRQVAKLLDQLEAEGGDEEVSIRERIMALAAIARIRIAYTKIAADGDENAGTTVRKYAAAFAANAAGGRGTARRAPRRAPEPADDDLADLDGLDGELN
jgi:hypothetical protein